jgi:triosephosphate isomerase (TIM)
MMAFSSRPFVAGNWKMNGLRASLAEFGAVRDACFKGAVGRAEVALCLPATLIMEAANAAAGSRLLVGGQDCHVDASGAHTGDISAEMLRDAGATVVIVGHSERRANHGESDALVRAKAEAAHRAGLLAIVCVGETRAERDAGETLRVVGRQIDESLPRGATATNTIVAYEPVWAIGTGLTPSAQDVVDVHGFIRRRLGGTGAPLRLLYGGSVKASNAAELLSIDAVDGALVGGASLTAKDFLGIAGVYR